MECGGEWDRDADLTSFDKSSNGFSSESVSFTDESESLMKFSTPIWKKDKTIWKSVTVFFFRFECCYAEVLFLTRMLLAKCACFVFVGIIYMRFGEDIF